MARLSLEEKNKNSMKAQKLIEMVKDHYLEPTTESIYNSLVFSEYVVTYIDSDGDNDTEVIMEKLDSVSSVFKHKADGKLCLLNFASYKNPGGAFITGSMAQEEAICHSSNLYVILNNWRFDNEFYSPNKKKLRLGLYNSNLIYTPDVLFFGNDVDTVKCDVITCAAPNRAPILRYHNDMLGDVNTAMLDRIDHLMFSAYVNKVDTLILGAFGCGIFKNDPTVTANIFKYLVYTKYKGIFKKVVFAIPDDKNYNVFWSVLNPE